MGLPFLLEEWTDPGNIYIAHRHMKFPEKVNKKNGNAVAVRKPPIVRNNLTRAVAQVLKKYRAIS
jgi:hypothetical protein